MLADSAASETNGSPAFARATSFTPNERRTQASTAARTGRTKGKGFLFGEEATNNDGYASGPEEIVRRGRRGSRRKDTIGSTGDETESKGIEEIGLDDVGKADK